MITKDNFSSIITDNTIVVNFDGQTHMIARTDACANKVKQAIKEGRYNDVPNLISATQRLEAATDGLFSVKDGQVYVGGVVAPRALGRKIEEFANEGLPYAPLVRFAKNLQSNPSFRAVNELYQFLEKNNHPVTEDGCFIAYKKVREDFKDIYSGTFDNSPGSTPEVRRNEVDEDPNQTCSKGLHVANWDYAHNSYGSHGQPMLEVKVNPADVVAVPIDYNQAKMRVCKYHVLGVVEEALSTTLRVVDPNYDLNSDSGEADCAENCDRHATCRDDSDVDDDVEEEEEDDLLEDDEEYEEEEEEMYCDMCDTYHFEDDDCVEDTEEYCADCDEYYDADSDHECDEDDDEYPWEDEVV